MLKQRWPAQCVKPISRKAIAGGWTRSLSGVFVLQKMFVAQSASYI